MTNSKRKKILLAVGIANLALQSFSLPELVEVIKNEAISTLMGQLARDPTLVESSTSKRPAAAETRR